MATSTKPWEFQTFPLKYEIITNKPAREVWVGNTLYAQPHFLPKKPRGGYTISYQEGYLHEDDVVDFNPKLSGKSFNKVRRKEYCRLMGPKFLKRFNGAMYDTWIKGWFDDKTKKLFFNHGYRYTTINNDWVYNAHVHYKDVQLLEDNDQHHLIPFVIYFDEKLETIKDRLKPIWKDLEANSITRNKYIARFLVDNEEVFNHLYLIKTVLSCNIKHTTNEHLLGPVGLLMVPFSINYYKVDKDFAKAYKKVVDAKGAKVYEDAIVRAAEIYVGSILKPVTIGNNKLFKDDKDTFFIIHKNSIWRFNKWESSGIYIINPPLDLFRVRSDCDKFLEDISKKLEDYMNGKGDST